MKNNNYPNWLVSLEIAQQLKEIGFKEECLCYWYEPVQRVECSTDDEDRLCPECYNYNTDETTTSLPLGNKSLSGSEKRVCFIVFVLLKI